MIGLGIAAIQAFEAVNMLFVTVLIFSSYNLLAEAEDEDDDLSNNSGSSSAPTPADSCYLPPSPFPLHQLLAEAEDEDGYFSNNSGV
ncbi:unnamed protein product [Closterium sp. NIES-65]|nr:unnamed protein product [Closterium sp. NIES-65]